MLSYNHRRNMVKKKRLRTKLSSVCSVFAQFCFALNAVQSENRLRIHRNSLDMSNCHKNE